MNATTRNFSLLCTMLLVIASGCVRVNLGTEEGKPIHIVHDVNIRLDKQLDDFFAFEQNAATQPTSQTVTTTQPASQPATTPAAVKS
jgi:hypothetical protein